MEVSKKCLVCGKELPISMFYLNKKSGFRDSKCDACRKEYMRNKYRQYVAEKELEEKIQEEAKKYAHELRSNPPVITREEVKFDGPGFTAENEIECTDVPKTKKTTVIARKVYNDFLATDYSKIQKEIVQIVDLAWSLRESNRFYFETYLTHELLEFHNKHV